MGCARSLLARSLALATALLACSTAWGRRLSGSEAAAQSNARAPLPLSAVAAALAAAAGSSDDACSLVDAACGGPTWEQASSAVVLLLLANPTSARFCTGAGAGCWAAQAPLGARACSRWVPPAHQPSSPTPQAHC